jgi:endo-1,4-beta-mannosidase
MEKIVRDGKVAVAVSGGFGAGWSTWNDADPMDARFNQLFLDGKYGEAAALCKKLDLGYGKGAYDVEIIWVPVGTEFRITEYDGSESIEYKDDIAWRKA